MESPTGSTPTDPPRRNETPVDVNSFSSVAAPYPADADVTARYFSGLIRRARAPISCADAGPVKGKAIYAARALQRAERVWSELPFVAMQHERNKRAGVACCQSCFLPLLDDYRGEWRDVTARWNAQSQAQADTVGPVDEDSLDEALRRLEVSPRGCGLAGPAVRCVCGDAYCSRECQARAFHESHALLCPRGDPCSAMGAFLQHMQHTNDIFLLVAKVIARVLSRYLVLRDIVKAREPIDMFYKKPWWEVVLEDSDADGHHEHHAKGDSGYEEDSDNREDSDGRPAGRRHAKRAKTHVVGPVDRQRPVATGSGLPNSSPNDVAMTSPPSAVTIRSPQYLQEVLALTHQLLLDALECNLVRLERENQLCGVSVDEVWRSCSSVLRFEFFAGLIGMFEMNNISLEVDHPFHALVDFFDADLPADVPHPTLSTEDRALVARVRRVLEWEETQRVAERQRSDGGQDGDAAGFLGIEGTALFPIMCTMNHSCDPNCTVLYTRNGEGHVVAIRDIQQGEELCICYIDIDMGLAARERNLKEYKFTCHCSRCAGDREAMEKTKQSQQQQQQQIECGQPVVSGDSTR